MQNPKDSNKNTLINVGLLVGFWTLIVAIPVIGFIPITTLIVGTTLVLGKDLVKILSRVK